MSAAHTCEFTFLTSACKRATRAGQSFHLYQAAASAQRSTYRSSLKIRKQEWTQSWSRRGGVSTFSTRSILVFLPNSRLRALATSRAWPGLRLADTDPDQRTPITQIDSIESTLMAAECISFRQSGQRSRFRASAPDKTGSQLLRHILTPRSERQAGFPFSIKLEEEPASLTQVFRLVPCTRAISHSWCTFRN